ncbi:MAG TPA: ABC-F family ATP-binding cassette domain-containing protein [Clostridiaceae bacterium]|nr:ABC-F family ATP-binding cassette domain-containing protein [Clostridiaceae bacterium]
MLHVNNLTIIRNRDQQTLISDLNFSLQKGDKLAVIGAEGNGKSSLLRVICRPKEAATYLDWTGEIFFGPYRIVYLAQECPQELLDKSIIELTLPSAEDNELYRLSGELNLDSELLFSSRETGSLSGGELMKLRLLLLFMTRPDIYVLDEPVNDLDLAGIHYIENFIKNSAEPILYVSHDETLLEKSANRILHIEQIWRRTEARVTYSGLGFREYREQFIYNVERQNKLAAKEEKDYQAKMQRHLAIQDKVHRDQENISRQDPSGGRLLKKKMHAVKSTGRRLEREHETQTQRTDREEDVEFFLEDLAGIPNNKEVINLQLPELYAGNKLLAKDISLLIRGPERIGITGMNGCGKTTLLRRIVDLLAKRSDIEVFYLPQDWQSLFAEAVSALDYLDPQGVAVLRQEAADLLGSLSFSREEMLRTVDTLSGGQKVKLAFAKMRLTRPNVLILDEPSRHLSPLTNPAFRDSIAAYPGCVISVSHDRVFLREICTDVLRLTAEGLIEEDPLLYMEDDASRGTS